jgi:TPP-dependent pyruvate/acetoin dehydrogenase alpha subunit
MSIPKAKLTPMFRMMVLIRRFEEKAMTLYLNGQLPGFLHSSLGQEAIPVGVSACLREDDYIATTHRGHGDILAKGSKADRMMAELFAKATGYCKGKGGSMHIADLDLGILGATGIVGGGIPIINGAALAAKLRGTDQVGVCYFGDGASNEGTFHEALNLAAIWDLPVVFVCHNNMYAESTPLSYHQKGVRDLADRALGYGMEGFSVDGNDVFEIYAATSRAVTRARKGEGPSLINCRTYRLTGHFVGDPGTLYRSKEEVEEAKSREPLGRFRRRLIDMKALTEEKARQIEADVEREIEAAVRFAQESPEPTAEELTRDVYC